MENKIERQDLIEIQKDITDTSNDLAENVNKKYILDAGIKKSSKISLISLVWAVISSIVLPSTLISAIFWALMVSLTIPTAIYGALDFKTTTKVNDLKEKLKDLNTLQRDMQMDYIITQNKQQDESKKFININDVVKVSKKEFETKKENGTTNNV